MWMALNQSVQGLTRTKSLTFPEIRGKPSSLTAWARTSVFSCQLWVPVNSNWNISSSWVLSLRAFGLNHMPSALTILRPLDSDWNYTISSPRSPACAVHILGLPYNKSLSLYMDPVGSASLGNPNRPSHMPISKLSSLTHVPQESFEDPSEYKFQKLHVSIHYCYYLHFCMSTTQ